MQLKFTLFAFAALIAFTKPGVQAAEGDILTATKVFHTIVQQSPFLVDRTTTLVWTQSSSISDSATPTPN
ncbi:hypothetical protein FA15DRAFT_673649 [Coprinopsis marcescibilis]|uniref:Uncharacterized protein n=1 Tax=Coprinopsis marcescibilis TaxID=230819 RepID=A0A5C3KK47_COPMA|nr:hypothetical protein FA15DRAFT_673649 [Coprinopsis marcescibilis]